MAFQFVPPFEEGNKQTNPETGVEYIFTSGAWRPLGPKIEDEFDTLDNRYIKLEGTTDIGDYYRLRGPNTAGNGNSTFQVIDEGEQKLYNIKTPDSSNTGWVANVKYVNDTVSDYLPLTGGTIQGELYFDVNADGQHNLGMTPHDADDTAVLYSMNGGVCRLRSLAGNDITSSNVRTHFGWGRNASGDPETVLYHLKDPTEPLHAVNRKYADDNYLALTGGDMTGAINIDRSSNQAIVISKDGTENLKLWVDGTVSTTKTTFSDDNFVTKAYVDNNAPTGDYMSKNGDNTVTTSWRMMGSGKTFIQNSNNTLGLYNLKEPSSSHHAARKQDLDNKVPGRFTFENGALYYNT
jgi:hypothetical protein